MRKPLLFALSVAGWLGCSSSPPSSSTTSPPGPPDGDASPAHVLQGPPPPPAGEDTTLPLEVIGVKPTSANLRFNLPADLLSGGARTSLELTIHNIRYAGEAAVSVNGGPDIALDGKFVRGWGGSSKGLVDVPLGQLKAGPNTLTFRFLAQQESVTGYRVMATNVVVDASGKTRSFAPELAHQDPITWKAPDPARASQGETLFNQRPTKADGTVEGACSDRQIPNDAEGISGMPPRLEHRDFRGRSAGTSLAPSAAVMANPVKGPACWVVLGGGLSMALATFVLLAGRSNASDVALATAGADAGRDEVGDASLRSRSIRA